MQTKENKMKNYEKILNTNLYDLLISINDRIEGKQCVIDILSSKNIDDSKCIANCSSCVQEWLNAEVQK